MLMSESVLPISEITVGSLLYYPRKAPCLLDIRNYFCAPVYIGKVFLDIYMNSNTGSVTLISQDNLSGRSKDGAVMSGDL